MNETRNLQELWEEYRNLSVEQDALPGQPTIARKTTDLDDFMASIRKLSTQPAPSTSAMHDEYAEWVATTDPGDCLVDDPIQYWLLRRRQYPRLSRMAIDRGAASLRVPHFLRFSLAQIPPVSAPVRTRIMPHSCELVDNSRHIAVSRPSQLFLSTPDEYNTFINTATLKPSTTNRRKNRWIMTLSLFNIKEMGDNLLANKRRGVKDIWKSVKRDGKKQQALHSTTGSVDQCIIVKP
ncbi:hypothetical protein FPOAC1_007202 [Fusarium poae]|uniref:hypothetical protein n=1 Tax=Fusarium poae TaxID=36050 RepID=UPI001CE9D482|nr:hypothetical protein FPOAC1_007202 [Fusarium poae]KAG8673883.1 hypothetical protein FPOAC1_007202 [Fusarium poae]